MMEGANSISTSKYKSNIKQTPTNNSNLWIETNEQRRNLGKKRDHSTEKEWTLEKSTQARSKVKIEDNFSVDDQQSNGLQQQGQSLQQPCISQPQYQTVSKKHNLGKKPDHSTEKEWTLENSLQAKSKVKVEDNVSVDDQQSNGLQQQGQCLQQPCISQPQYQTAQPQQYRSLQQPSKASQQQYQPSQQSTVSQQYQHSQLSSQHIQPHAQPMGSSFPPYGYNVYEQYNVDASQRPFPMMAPCNMYATMSPRWSGTQMDGMGMPMNTMPNNSGIPVATNLDMAPSTSAGINPYAAYMPMAGEMYGMMNGIGNFCPYPMYNQETLVPPVKKTIILPSCYLYPPHPGQHIKSRERHPGCKTVFVGGLPEKITEEIIREIFDHCGGILTVRMSKKNFCHVRFALECHVDEAMKLSGYRLKIENKDESSYSGRLHIDFAKARDDEYEYDCMQRALQREARHRERLELELSRPPTPPPVVHYSEHEGSLLSDQLKSENHDEAVAAIHVLITWLERGECNRKTCGNFYTMIRCNNTSAKRLLSEKDNLVKELDKSKKQMEQNVTLVSLCFNDIYKVFETIHSSPQILDSFSKPQKREIEALKTKTWDIVKTHSQEVVEERVEEEMDLSDDEENAEKPTKSTAEVSKSINKEDLQKLREEVKRLRSQYTAASEEKENLKKERESSSEAYNKIYKEMQERVLSKQKEVLELKKIKENYLAMQKQVQEVPKPHEASGTLSHFSGNNQALTQHEIRLITLVATFLNVHPFGASIDYICSYLIKIDSKINRRDMENLLHKFPNLFKEQSSGIGATLVKNWKFLGFTSNSD